MKQNMHTNEKKKENTIEMRKRSYNFCFVIEYDWQIVRRNSKKYQNEIKREL